MAIPQRVTITVVDDSMEAARTDLYFPDTATQAEIEAELAVILPALDALTQGRITDATLTKALALPAGLGTVAVAAGTIENKAAFGFLSADRRVKEMTVPAFDPTYFTSNGRDVDITDADVLAFGVAVTTEVAPGTGSTDAANADLVSLKYAKRRAAATRS